MVQRLSRKLNRLFLGTARPAPMPERMAVMIMVPESRCPNNSDGQVEPVEHGICDPCEDVLILKNVDEKASG